MASETQMSRKLWPEMRTLLETTFATRTRDEWAEIFHQTDACVTPVYAMDEVMEHSHAQERGLLWNRERTNTPSATDKVCWEPAPAPQLSRTPAAMPADVQTPKSGEHTEEILRDLGIATQTMEKVLANAETGHNSGNSNGSSQPEFGRA